MTNYKMTKKDLRQRESMWFKCLGCLLGINVAIIGILCAVYELPKKFIDSKFSETLRLAPDSPIYSDWINPPVPIYMRFHIFNVTNRDEIVKGEKPKIEECGPYTYRMQALKFNVTFYPNDTVSYFNNYTLFFEPSMSVGRENDSIYQLNVPLASLGVMTKKMPFYDFFGVMNRVVKLVGGSELFPIHTVREILFGYRDPIFSVLDKVSMFLGQAIDPYFGFFHKFNNSHDGHFLISTGRRRNDEAYRISKWNGEKYLNFWSTKYANMINGSDGSFLGSNLTPEDTPYLFFPQMFRSMKLECEGKSAVKDIETLRFHLSNDFLASTTESPDNEGFCVPSGNCFDSGVLNIQSCMEGAPGFISLPHFYKAASVYQNAVSGLNPTKEKHDSFYYAEPKSGAVIKSHRRLQLNILMQPSDLFETLKHVRETIFPILWLGGSAEIQDEAAEKLKMAIGIAKYLPIASYVLIFTGCLTFFVFAFCALKKRLTIAIRRFFPGIVKSREKSLEVKV